MSVEQANVIDTIGIDPVTGSVTMTATDHLEWESDEHLLLLQNKLNAYLAFVESGEIFETYPAAVGKSVKFDVVCKFPPDDKALQFFALCSEVVRSAGFEFGYRVREIQALSNLKHNT